MRGREKADMCGRGNLEWKGLHDSVSTVQDFWEAETRKGIYQSQDQEITGDPENKVPVEW